MKAMKYIVGLVLIMLTAIASMSQGYPIQQNIGSGKTLVNIGGTGALDHGGARITGMLQLLDFEDTTSANSVPYVKTYPGAMIRTGQVIWVRNTDATGWTLLISNASSAVTYSSVLNDSTIVICNGFNVCDTISISSSVTNISTVSFLTDSSIVVCDSLGSCDTIIINHQNIYVFQNGVNSPYPGIVEWGGFLYHDTEINTYSSNILFHGITVQRYITNTYQLQDWGVSSAIASFRGNTHNPLTTSELDYDNLVRLGVNYTGKDYADNGNTIQWGYMQDKIGYFFGTNLYNGGAFGLAIDDNRSKFSGVFYHTFDTTNNDVLTFYGNRPPLTTYYGNLNNSGDNLIQTRIMTLKYDKDVQLFGYTNARNDGTNPQAGYGLYVDADGILQYGPLGGGGGGGGDSLYGIQDQSYYVNRNNNGHNLYSHTIDSIDKYGIRISGDADSYFDVYDLTNAEERVYVDNKESTFMGPGSTYGMSFTLTGTNLYNLEATDTTEYVVAYAGAGGLYKTTKTSIIGSAYVSIASYGDSCFIITRNNATQDTVCFSSSVINNSNVGAGYRLLKPGTQEIKTLFAGTGITIDSTTNADGLTISSAAGSGTVTDFIFTDANGFDGTVATSTTTPTLSLTTTVTDDRVFFSNSGAIGSSADFIYDGNGALTVGGSTPAAPADVKLHILNGANFTNGTADAGFYNILKFNGWWAVGIPTFASGTTLAYGDYKGSTWTAIRFYMNAIERLKITATDIILNEDGTDQDFRVEGDGNINMIWVDAGNDVLHIGGTTSLGTQVFQINGSGALSGRWGLNKGADVVAAGDLTLGSDGNLFTITGATTINAITTANWRSGSQIAFIFTGAPLVKNNTAGGAGTATMLLSGRTDFQAAAGDYIAFQYDGTNWYETERQLAATVTGANIYNSNGTTTGVRTVTLGNNAITWTGTQASSANYAFNISNSGAGGAIGASNTGLGNAVFGNTTTGVGVSGSATSGTGLNGAATTGLALRVRTTIAATNTETSIAQFTKGSDGTAAAGLGGYIQFAIEDDASNDQEVARIGWVSTSVVDGAEAADIKFSTTTAGSLTEKVRITGNGRLVVSGRFSPAQGADVASAAGAIALGTDGNTFEITGTAAITLISNLNWVNGNEVTLLFTSTASLVDGTANSGTDIGMELAGNINFTGSAGSTLTLVLSEIGGTQRWREKARSVN
jgi:hypothetical protein